MADRRSEDEPHPRFHDDLVGLDPHDPEARAFAEHLDRVQRCDPAYTVEASIDGVGDFARSSHRAGGLRWWVAVVVVVLILFGVLVASWDILVRISQWLAG
ncbi:hypothetical protein EWH70_23515 [Amycolatopsis suaedae]|uniref:Uncharacterized protein n=2 Tax=Amycolatopsis suaedae TaxID=2510978 RepID=A0A4Q7J346_9PSEU|nr:hypothetical protein [Amycolatopsis suaedae]RZQ61367.1 hypothetical protein EWH70_23515 [Amycolatopsis suaedae]